MKNWGICCHAVVARAILAQVFLAEKIYCFILIFEAILITMKVISFHILTLIRLGFFGAPGPGGGGGGGGGAKSIDATAMKLGG